MGGRLPGNCPVCGNEVALRKGDLVREHRNWRFGRGRLRICPGSGKPLAQKMDRGSR